MALDSKGNQAVEFVWGNLPMQPDTGRGQVLDKTLDGHGTHAAGGYSGYPGFVPNVGVLMPNLVGMTRANALAAIPTYGLKVGTVTGATGSITVQSVAAAARVAPGTAINVTSV